MAITSMIADGNLLQMEPRTDLVAESMLHGADHRLAGQPIAWAGSTHREIMELLRKCQSRAVSTVRAVIEIEALEGRAADTSGSPRFPLQSRAPA